MVPAMNEKEILSVSLASLLKIYPLQPGDIYYDGCLMGYREALERETAIMDLFRFPTRIDAFGVVFCSKGSATVTADLKHCVIGGQTMFVCPPGTIIQVESQQQAAVRFILCEEDFINRIRIDHAKRLAQETSMSLEDLAEAVGYASLRTFYRAFTKMEGTTPAKGLRRA